MIKGIFPKLPEFGKIKIGTKGEERTSKSGKNWRMPTKSDHFLITKNERDVTGNFILDTELMTKLGASETRPLTELDISLLFDDIDKNFFTSYALYEGKKRRCWGDGVNATRLIDMVGENGKIVRTQQKSVLCEGCKYLKEKKCKPSGILICLLKETNRIGGAYAFRTHSWNSITNIISSISFISQLTGGILAGLPLKLTLTPKTVNVEGKMYKIYVTNIEFAGDWQQLREKTIELAKIRMNSQTDLKKYITQAKNWLALPETTEEQKDVQEEFYPQQDKIEDEFTEKKQEIKKEPEAKSNPVTGEENFKLNLDDDEQPITAASNNLDSDLKSSLF